VIDLAGAVQWSVGQGVALFAIGAFFILITAHEINAPVSAFANHPTRSAVTGMLGAGVSMFLLLLVVNLIGALVLRVTVMLGILELSQVMTNLVTGVELALRGAIPLIILYGGRVIVALVIGWLIAPQNLRSRVRGERTAMLLSLGIGVIVLSVVGLIPLLGQAIHLAAAVVGFGAIITPLVWRSDQLRIGSLRWGRRIGGSPNMIVFDSPSNANPRTRRRSSLAPPIPDEMPLTPGAENLPEGFKWWD
jgi:hypothetical protein